MLKRNALTLALLLAVLASWAVRPAVGDDEDAPAPPSADEVLADHEARIAELERKLGDPQRAAGSIDARLRAAELEIEQIARDLEAAEDDGEGGADLRGLQRSVDALTVRVERMDRNRLAAIEREVDAIQRELRNLDNRLRRVE